MCVKAKESESGCGSEREYRTPRERMHEIDPRISDLLLFASRHRRKQLFTNLSYTMKGRPEESVRVHGRGFTYETETQHKTWAPRGEDPLTPRHTFQQQRRRQSHRRHGADPYASPRTTLATFPKSWGETPSKRVNPLSFSRSRRR